MTKAEENHSRGDASKATAGFSECPVFVLAGGLGTRLRAACSDRPKALAPVGGKPFLAFVLEIIAEAGLRRVVLCTGYRGGQIEDWLGDGGAFGVTVSYSHEHKPMGTAGALRLAYARYGEGKRSFAMNGDSILKLSLREMWQNHTDRGALASIALTFVLNAARYGSVDVNEQKWVTAFREKNQEPRPGLINGGIYLLDPSVVESISGNKPVSMEREVLPEQVSRGLLGYESSNYFVDIGIPDDLLRAQAELEAYSVPHIDSTEPFVT